MNAPHDPRITELLDLTASESIDLPLPVKHIVDLEDAGHVVDLRTGDIIYDADDVTFHLTVVGQATAHQLSIDPEVTL